jgi:hypothetical protein
LYNSLTIGPNYTETLKKIRTKSILKTFLGMPYETDPEMQNLPSYSLKDIGDIFHPRNLFFWEKVDSDVKYFSEPLDFRGDEEEFKRELRVILEDVPDSIQFMEEEDIICNPSSSMNLIADSLETKPNYLQKQRPESLTLSKGIGLCKVLDIQKNADEVRTITIANVRSVNTIQVLDKWCWGICEYIPNIITNTDPNELYWSLKGKVKHTNYYFHRDVKKDGITKPRILLKWVLEVLSERWDRFTKYQHFFESFKISYNDILIDPIRGHGLGFANAITCLIYSTLHGIILSRAECNLHHLDCSIYNDDYLVLFEHDHILEEYFSVLDEVYEQYGLILNKRKSFISTGGAVFCELYVTPYETDLNKKESLYRGIMLNTLNKLTIVQAKQYFSSCVGVETSHYAHEYIKLFINKFGYEFYNKEYENPLHLGGWFPKCIKGIKVLDPIDNMYALWKGSQYHEPPIRLKRKVEGVYNHPFLVKNHITVLKEGLLKTRTLQSEIESRVKYNLTFGVIKALKEKRNRLKIFRFWSKYFPTNQSELDTIVLESNEDFILPREYYKVVPMWDIIIKDDYNPYKVKNPFKSYLHSICGLYQEHPPNRWHLEYIDKLSLNSIVERGNDVLNIEDYHDLDQEIFFLNLDYLTNPKEFLEIEKKLINPNLVQGILRVKYGLSNMCFVPKIGPNTDAKTIQYGKYLNPYEWLSHYITGGKDISLVTKNNIHYIGSIIEEVEKENETLSEISSRSSSVLEEQGSEVSEERFFQECLLFKDNLPKKMQTIIEHSVDEEESLQQEIYDLDPEPDFMPDSGTEPITLEQLEEKWSNVKCHVDDNLIGQVINDVYNNFAIGDENTAGNINYREFTNQDFVAILQYRGLEEEVLPFELVSEWLNLKRNPPTPPEEDDDGCFFFGEGDG